jgi:uncharacterized membrane protein
MKNGTKATARAAEPRYLLRPILLATIALLAIGGMAVSSYLAYGNIGDESLFCELGHGCDTVQASEYSAVLGVPVAVWGALLYLAILAAAVAGLSRSSRLRELSSFALFGMGLAGTLYSGYLAWVELYRIEAVCMWCTISAVLLTGILFISVANLAVRAGSGPTTGRGRRRQEADWATPGDNRGHGGPALRAAPRGRNWRPPPRD